MRIRNYKLGYNKDVVVVKGRIKRFIAITYDKKSGMMLTTEIDDSCPMVEYGVIGWPFREPIDEKHLIIKNNWTMIGAAKDGYGDKWAYYTSNPVRTYTEDDVQEIFERYFAPLLNENMAIGKDILADFDARRSEESKERENKFKDV